MTEHTAEISPRARYRLRMLELAENDPQITRLIPIPSVREALTKPGLSLDRIIDTVLDGYAGRPALGDRDYEIVKEPATGRQVKNYLPGFATSTYAELQFRIKSLARAWRQHPEHRVAADEFVCIMGFASTDFAILDLACAYAQAVTVPLQSSTSGADLDEIFNNINPAALAATINDLLIAAQQAVKHGAIRSLIVFDYDQRDDNDRIQFEAAKSALESAGVDTRLTTLDELIAYGKSDAWEFLPASQQAGDRMAAIIHSSGSTGTPKGAIVPERALTLAWISRPKQLPMVSILFAPLNHLLGRSSLVSTLTLGGTLYFTLMPDMSTLFEDIRLARPTFMNFFPRVFELIYQHYQNEVTRRVSNGEGSEVAVSEKVKQEMRTTYLGDRLRGAVVGGAPTAPSVMKFMRDCFDMMLIEGYGNTESGSGNITMDGVIQRPPVTEYKLRDVPELGYYSTDKPFPRGELCYKSSVGITSYYKQPTATEGLFDEHGFSLTGDIVEERAPDYVIVVDRRKDVIKLSHGEYVAIGNLGTVFEAGSAVIKQIYIYGNSLRAYLLAVVVADAEVVKTVLGDDPAQSALKMYIRDEMQKVAGNEALKSFEVPKDFIIEDEPFSQENGLLSSVRKRLRPALLAKYGERLESLYEALERRQEQDIRALKDPDSKLSVLDKLAKLLESNLKIQDIDVSSPRSYAQLGGDSLGAVLLCASIEEIFDVSFPADNILSPTGSPQRWAQMIEAAQAGGGDRPSFAKVHGKNATHLHARDLHLANFLDRETLTKAEHAAEPGADHQKPPKTVLLTGANGFLGHIVCLDWLQQLASRDGKLICLIRAADNATARLRLDQAFEGLDAEFEHRYRSLAKQHLEVLAGDAGEARLGLSDDDFSRLADEVDRISHVAALVNHRFAYEHLFGPNVVGTAEIIRLALSGRKKPIDFVSSEAVYALLDTRAVNNEDSPLQQEIQILDHYAAGYGQSKWAGEHLLQNANRQFGIPVNILRGDMMLSHRVYKGQMNTADMFIRLLFSVITTGLAPHSFYKLLDDGSKASGHYDGTPVDVVAAAVVGVAEQSHRDCRTFNIQNYHFDDGCSLDAFIDWIEAAGYPLTRVQDHGEWLQRFKDKLNSLPDQQRQQSALEILGAFQRPLIIAEKHVGCDRFRALVKGLTLGPEVPHLSREYIHKCLDDMRCLGFIDGVADSRAG